MKELHELKQDLACLRATREDAADFGEWDEFNRLNDECAALDAIIKAQLKEQENEINGTGTGTEAPPRSSAPRAARFAITGIIWGARGRDAAVHDFHRRRYARDTGKWEGLFAHLAAIRTGNPGNAGVEGQDGSPGGG